jgi:asparagine synthase (glutamine-hydrolysing)
LNCRTKVSEAIGRKLGRIGLPPWVIDIDEAAFYEDRDRDRILMRKGLQYALKNTLENRLVNLFRYCDRNSMAFSVEARVPFMLPELVELAQSLPSEYLFGPSGASKYILREAMRGLVPNQILDRKDKIGFENDDMSWLLTESLGPWVETIFRESAERCSLISAKKLKMEWSSGLQEKRGLAKRFWHTIIFLRWLELNNLHC